MAEKKIEKISKGLKLRVHLHSISPDPESSKQTFLHTNVKQKVM